MDLIPYVPPAEPLTAAHWNAVFARCEAILSKSLGGCSAVLAGIDSIWPVQFFFFDSTILPADEFHPVARKYFETHTSTFEKRLRWNYNHANLVALVAACTTLDHSDKYEVVKLSTPSHAQMIAAIGNAGFARFGQYTNDEYNNDGSQKVYNLIGTYEYMGVTYYMWDATNIDGSRITPPDWLLKLSLQIHKRSQAITHGGVTVAKDCPITFGSAMRAERELPFVPIDIFIKNSLTWDSAWNKYSIVRVHNCSLTDATVAFGSVSAVVETGASKCFRRVGADWIVCGDYFHTMQLGDGRFWNHIAPESITNDPIYGATQYCPIFKPSYAIDLINSLRVATGIGVYFTPAAESLADLSSIYNNSAAIAGKYAVPIPTGGFYPDISTVAGLKLGDLIVHRGKYLVANLAPSPGYVVLDFTGFSALAAALAAVGLTMQTTSGTISGVSFTTYEIVSSNTYDTSDLLNNPPIKQVPAIVDLSCPLAQFISGKWSVFIGKSQSPSPSTLSWTNPISGTYTVPTPKSVIFPMLTVKIPYLKSQTTTSSYPYYGWYYDSGTPLLDADASYTTLSNLVVKDSGSNKYPKMFNVLDDIADVVAWVNAFYANDAGILAAENFKLAHTPFGHYLLWDEVYPLDSTLAVVLPAEISGADGNQWSVDMWQASSALGRARFEGGRLFIRRSVKLDIASIYPPNDSARRATGWNFARTEKAFQFHRFFYHNLADAPWMEPELTSLGNTTPKSGWAASLPAANQIGGIAGPKNIHPLQLNVSHFYEQLPVTSKDSIAPLTAVDSMPGIAKIWEANPSYYIGMELFLSYFLAGKSSFGYTVGGGSASYPIAASWLKKNVLFIVPPGGNYPGIQGDPQPDFFIAAEALACQDEQFNAAASIANGIVTQPIAQTLSENKAFTLRFGAGDVTILNGGSGYSVGDVVSVSSLGGSIGLKVGSVDSAGAALTVYQDGSVFTYSTTAPGPERPFLCAGGMVIDTSYGDASTLDFVPSYAPLAVPGWDLTTPSEITTLGTGGVWPRGCFYAWRAGITDPIGDYLAATWGLTVQTTLPDSYGAAQEISNYVLKADGSLAVEASGTYANRFDTFISARCSGYRWITIDDARTLYARLNLTFILDDVLVPAKCYIANTTGTKTELKNETVSHPTESEDGIVYSDAGASPAPAPGAPNSLNTGYDQIIAPSNRWTIGFLNDAAGNWVTRWTSINLASSSSARAPGKLQKSLPVNTGSKQCVHNWNWTGSWTPMALPNYSVHNWYAYQSYDETRVDLAIGYSRLSFMADPVHIVHWPDSSGFPVSDDEKFTVQPLANSYSVVAAWTNFTAILYLLENVPDRFVARVPENFAAMNLSWFSAPAECSVEAGFTSSQWPWSGGTEHLTGGSDNAKALATWGWEAVPRALHTIESSSVETSKLSGAGGSGQYEHLITTDLDNARIVAIPLN